MNKSFILTIIFIFLLVAVTSLPGHSTTRGEIDIGWTNENPSAEVSSDRHYCQGPPPHAPAWGHRAKYQYWYYPDASVYFDVNRGVYFYMEGSDWRMGVSLPSHYRERLHEHVIMELDTDRPYIYFEQHKREHPPKHWKHKHK